MTTLGYKHTEETKVKMRKAKLGIKHTQEARANNSKSKMGILKSKEHRQHIRESKLGNKNPMYGKCGEHSANWKGGKTTTNQLIRTSQQYKDWRTKVFNRDEFTCQDCGKVGGYLEAHHIKSFAEYEELRFDINNGITYCKECHAKNDKYRNIGDNNE